MKLLILSANTDACIKNYQPGWKRLKYLLSHWNNSGIIKIINFKKSRNLTSRHNLRLNIIMPGVPGFTIQTKNGRRLMSGIKNLFYISQMVLVKSTYGIYFSSHLILILFKNCKINFHVICYASKLIFGYIT